MSPKHREMGLLEKADGLATTQETFTAKQGIKLYGENPEGGSEAICHNAVVEDLALPGQIVIGTDSHTCMAGVLGCFAFGVGSTDMANAWYTKDIRIRVPETVRYVLKGKKRADVAAKDVMLYILATDYMKTSKGIGKVLEFAGDDLKNWPMDERATLTNMAVEAGGTTGIIEPDEVDARLHRDARAGSTRKKCAKDLPYSDPDAEYAAVFEIDLDEIRPMVAMPGDPRNGIPIDELGGRSAHRRRVRRLLHRRQDGRHGHVRRRSCRTRWRRASASRRAFISICSLVRRRSSSTRAARATSKSSKRPAPS